MATSDIFTGASRYSSDFQAVIERSVSIASLPMTQMQQSKLQMSDEASALRALDSRVEQVQNSLAAIGDSFGFKAFSTSVSNGSLATVRTSDGVAEGTYTLKILDLGSYATALSKGSLPVVTDPAAQSISNETEYTLKVGDSTVTVTPAGDSLNSLVEAINSSNAGVQATVVNLSPNGVPQYSLSLQSKKLGPVAIELSVGGTQLLDAPTGGTMARYTINGRTEESQSDSRTITLSTGLTVDLLRADADNSMSISVTRSSNNLKSAIETFINSYNSTVDEMNKHVGNAGGALAGNSVLFGTNDILRRIGGYASSNAGLTSMSAVGIMTDREGKLYLDSSQWDAVKDNLSGLSDFFGKADQSGFLKATTDNLDVLRNSDSGLLSSAIETMDDQIESTDDRIAEQQNRLDDLRISLQEKFAAADALIAALEQQASYFIGMFQAMKSNQDSFNG